MIRLHIRCTITQWACLQTTQPILTPVRVCPCHWHCMMQVVVNPAKDYTDRPEVTRIASSNGSWDHLAVNKIARMPMGTGTAPPPISRRTSSINGSMVHRGVSSVTRGPSATGTAKNNKDVV